MRPAYITPTMMSVNNSKTYRYLSLLGKNLVDIGQFNTESEYGKTRTITTMRITGDSCNGCINPFDQLVLNAAYTIYLSGNCEFSLGNIVRLISANSNSDLTKKRIQAVSCSIDKLKSLSIEINMKEEAKARKLNMTEAECILKSYLLPVEELTLKTKTGMHRKYYRFVTEPAIFRYAEILRQIVTYPLEQLNIDSIRDDIETILIKHYLIKKIELMKNQKNKLVSNRVSLEWYDHQDKRNKGLLYELGFKENGVFYVYDSEGERQKVTNQRNKKSKINNTIAKILDAFKSNGYIEDYVVNKTNKSIQSYTIVLSEK